MGLTEEDKSDLMGLVSGFETPKSKVRARRLAGTNAEAAEYLRQMRLIARACQPPEDEDTNERLPSEEVDRITDSVYHRWRRHRLRRISTAFGAAAAILLAMLIVSQIVNESDQRAKGTLIGHVYYIPYPRLHSFDNKLDRPIQIFENTEITTIKEFAKITLNNGTVVALSQYTTSRIGKEGRSLILEKGDAFIRTAGSMVIHFVDAEVVLEAGKIALSITDTGRIYLYTYQGIARIKIEGESHEVAAGQQCRWSQDEPKIWIDSFDDTIPNWVTHVLQAN